MPLHRLGVVLALALIGASTPVAAQTLAIYPMQRDLAATRHGQQHASASARMLLAEGDDGWQKASEAARAEPEAFRALLREHLRHPDRSLPDTELGRAVRAAEVATSDAAYSSVRARAANDQKRGEFDTERLRLRAAYEEVAAEEEEEGGTKVFVTADGNFRGVTNGGGEGAPVGTGSLSLTAVTGFANLKAGIAIASTQDTVRDDFGTAMLAPASGRALTSGLLDARLNYLPVHLYFTASRSLWQVQDTPSVITSATTVLGMGALLYGELAAAKVQETDLRLSIEGGVALRFLGGDFMALDSTTRRSVLSTSRSAFIGPEVGMQITVGKMAGALQLYYMPHNDHDRVPGFSGLQLVAGIGVSGELFGSRRNRD